MIKSDVDWANRKKLTGKQVFSYDRFLIYVGLVTWLITEKKVSRNDAVIDVATLQENHQNLCSKKQDKSKDFICIRRDFNCQLDRFKRKYLKNSSLNVSVFYSK